MKKFSKEEVLGIMRELHDKLDTIYGHRLKGVYLYGSYARGDAWEESDIDVAIILAGDVDVWEERERTGSVISDICLRENCIIQTMFLTEQEFRDRPFDYHRNLAVEGIPV